MRWPADMYAALECRRKTEREPDRQTPDRPPPRARDASIPMGLMAVVILFIVCVALGATYVSRAASNDEAGRRATPDPSAVRLNAQVTSEVVALATVDSGRVASLEVPPGEEVAKDTILVRLDDTSDHEALAQAKNELRLATKELEAEEAWIEYQKPQTQAAIDRLTATLLGCDADIQAAQATAVRWDQEQARMQDFLRPHLALQREKDEVQLQVALAAAAVARASARKLETEKKLATARIQLNEPNVRQLVVQQIRERITIAEQRIASAEAAIEQSLVRAPSDGRVIEYLCNSGSHIRRGDRLLALQSDNEVWLEAWATTDQAQHLRLGDEVDIQLHDQSSPILVGRVEAVSTNADHDLRSWNAIGSYQPSDGQHATHRLRISLPEGQSGLTVGTRASVQKHRESSLQAGNAKRLFVAATAH